MTSMTDSGVTSSAVQECLDDLPASFWVVHKDENCAIWTDGVHHGGAVAGPFAHHTVNTLAAKYGFGLREAWKDDGLGIHLLAFCILEGSGFP